MYTLDEIEVKNGCSSCRYCCYCEETKTLRCYFPNWLHRPSSNDDLRDRSWCSWYRERNNPNEITVKKTYGKNITHLSDDKQPLDVCIDKILAANTEDKALSVVAFIIQNIEAIRNDEGWIWNNRKINIAENNN